MGSCIAAWVRLVDGVVVGVGTPDAAKMLASCWIASMVWVPKQAKGVAGAGFVMSSARHLAASMAASTEDIAGMALLGGGGLYSFGDVLSLCLRYVNVVASLVEWGCADAPTFLAMEVPCSLLLWGVLDEYFCT